MRSQAYAQLPYYAYVMFSIGEYDVTPIPSKHLKSFTYERITDSSTGSANKFTIVCYDDTGLELEYAIAKGLNDCKFHYGFEGGATSPEYTAQITYCKSNFSGGGVEVTIEGVTKGLTAMTTPKSSTYSGDTIDTIVENIAKEEGWVIGYIEKCASVSDGSNSNKTFIRSNMDAITFITSELIPYAKSADTGECGFSLYFKDNNPGKGATVYFCPPNWRGAGSSDEYPEYEFEVFGDNYGNVLNFEPENSGLLTAVLGSSSVDAQSIDTLKNEMFHVTVDKDSNSNRAVLGEKTMDVSQYKAIVGSSSSTADELENMSASLWYHNASQSYPATLQIIGDPGVEPQTYITVLAMLRNGVPHHTSGIYLVSSVTDEITGGSFTTTLNLIRNGINLGVDSNGSVSVQSATAIDTSKSGNTSTANSTNSATNSNNPTTKSLLAKSNIEVYGANTNSEAICSKGLYSYPVVGDFSIPKVYSHNKKNIIIMSSSKVVKSCTEGLVVEVRNSNSGYYGSHIVVETGNYLIYYGLLDEVIVEENSWVSIDDKLGTHSSNGLLLEVRHECDTLDPLMLLGITNVVDNIMIEGDGIDK